MYTTEFILTSFFLTITLGVFMGMIIVGLLLEYSSPIIKWIVGIIIAIAIGCGLGTLITLENINDDKAWNNGYCTECNGNYKLISVVDNKNGDDEYYYSCEPRNVGKFDSIHDRTLDKPAMLIRLKSVLSDERARLEEAGYTRAEHGVLNDDGTWKTY